jgi:hypothetical protein
VAALGVRASDVARNALACAWSATGDECGQRTSRRANIIWHVSEKKIFLKLFKCRIFFRHQGHTGTNMGGRGKGDMKCVAFVALTSFRILPTPFLLVLLPSHPPQHLFRIPRNVFNKTTRSSIPASTRRPCRFLRTPVQVPCLGRRTGRVLERRRRSKSFADARSYRKQSSQCPRSS